jgi:predicted acetyltransferase
MDSYRSIWTFLATMHDLVGEISIQNVPADDPATSIFLEPRLLRTKIQPEGSWWRIVDVKGALEHRRYNTLGGNTLTVAVVDDERLAPWNTGTWSINVNSAGAATVNKTHDSVGCAEVTVGVAALASLWSGAVSALQLHQWGLLETSDEDALLKASTFFCMPKSPFCFDGW